MGRDANAAGRQLTALALVSDAADIEKFVEDAGVNDLAQTLHKDFVGGIEGWPN